METHDNTEDQESWMNDPEEVAIRILEDPSYFEARYPDEYAGLAKKVDQMAIHDPGGFRVRIIQFLDMLPKMIKDAQERPKSAKIVGLARIEKAIRQIVIPPVPVHDDVWDLIQSREEELREYHLQVLGLMQEIDDNNDTVHFSVYDLAAMCCCLQMAGFIGDVNYSVRKMGVKPFIRAEIKHKYFSEKGEAFGVDSLADKCSKFLGNENLRTQKENSFKQAILLMKRDKNFRYEPAIKQAETILAKINADRK